MLRGRGTDFLIRGIHAERFEGIAAGLYDIFKCDAALGREIISHSLMSSFLRAKAKQEQFEKICQAMNRPGTIDRRKTEELLKRFNPAWLSERCAASFGGGPSQGLLLSELAGVERQLCQNGASRPWNTAGFRVITPLRFWSTTHPSFDDDS